MPCEGLVISVSRNKKDIHLLFNMDDERHRTAYQRLIEQSSARTRSDFMIEAILAYQNNAELARMIVEEIAKSGVSVRKPTSPKVTAAPTTGKPGRPRGRPPKPKPELPEVQPAQPTGLSSVPTPASTTPQMPQEADGDNQSLLKAIQESFG